MAASAMTQAPVGAGLPAMRPVRATTDYENQSICYRAKRISCISVRPANFTDGYASHILALKLLIVGVVY